MVLALLLLHLTHVSFDFFQAVDASQSTVTAAGTKIDVKLKKLQAETWDKLSLDA